MAWFSFLQSEDNATPSTISPPLRRVIDIDELENPIFSEEIISIKLYGKKMNSRLSEQLIEVEDDDAYLVVYQDDADESFFIPVKSKIIDDILYFQVHEDISSGIDSSRHYVIYYGMNNLKYLNYLTENQYQQESEIAIESVAEGDYYDLSVTEVINAFFIASQDSSKSFQLALYDNGNAWVDGKSALVGAKAFGVFDGPDLNILGSKGVDFGKFKIRINKVLEDNTFSKTIAIDWQEVDCFARENLSNQVLFSTTGFLDYERYVFEIETLSDKNINSTSNGVEISSYSFVPNYKITYLSEEINPSIPFIRIGGIR